VGGGRVAPLGRCELPLAFHTAGRAAGRAPAPASTLVSERRRAVPVRVAAGGQESRRAPREGEDEGSAGGKASKKAHGGVGEGTRGGNGGVRGRRLSSVPKNRFGLTRAFIREQHCRLCVSCKVLRPREVLVQVRRRPAETKKGASAQGGGHGGELVPWEVWAEWPGGVTGKVRRGRSVYACKTLECLATAVQMGIIKPQEIRGEVPRAVKGGGEAAKIERGKKLSYTEAMHARKTWLVDERGRTEVARERLIPDEGRVGPVLDGSGRELWLDRRSWRQLRLEKRLSADDAKIEGDSIQGSS